MTSQFQISCSDLMALSAPDEKPAASASLGYRAATNLLLLVPAALLQIAWAWCWEPDHPVPTEQHRDDGY